VYTTGINPIVPLAMLHAMRSLDAEKIEEGGPLAEEGGPQRLGTSRTVTAQIARYRGLVEQESTVDADEVVQLFRLVARRSDAGLVFNAAGRWAAREAMDRLPLPMRVACRWAPGASRRRFGLRAARRLGSRMFGAALSWSPSQGVAAVADTPAPEAADEGVACGFYGAALAELLRGLTQFDGAMIHATCRARGDDACRWHTGGNPGKAS
jgi:hypothetical protein